ncbi:MAG TPA: hypothetical protein VFF67_08060 [Thermoplasmata archaeon]|nr:hypothetical protein [Thermoplasmata archaeon]
MAETETTTAERPAPPRPRWSLVRRVEFFGFAALALLGLVFYLWWGFSFGVWIDNGVYAVVSVLVLFGLAGMWLVMPNAPVPAPDHS